MTSLYLNLNKWQIIHAAMKLYLFKLNIYEIIVFFINKNVKNVNSRPIGHMIVGQGKSEGEL